MTTTQTQFRLPIGAKRQVTIPQECMNLLSLEKGQMVLLQVEGQYATLKPMVSVVRDELPEALRKKFESRRGKKPTDLPLSEFMKKLDRRPKVKLRAAPALAAAAARARK